MAAMDDKASLDGFQVWTVVTDDSSNQDGVGLAAAYCIAVAVDIVVKRESLDTVGEERRAVDQGERNCLTDVEWAVGVVAVGDCLRSDLNERRIHDDLDLFCSVQSIVCRSSRD